MEQTFIMISFDGVQGGLVGETIMRFRNMHFSLKDLKTISVDRRFAEKQYADLIAALFFGESADYITSVPAFVFMVWEGENVVLTGQNIIGATNSSESAPGTNRGDFIGRNFIHGSDSVESARKEIALWFPNLESGLPNLIPE